MISLAVMSGRLPSFHSSLLGLDEEGAGLAARSLLDLLSFLGDAFGLAVGDFVGTAVRDLSIAAVAFFIKAPAVALTVFTAALNHSGFKMTMAKTAPTSAASSSVKKT